jgi:ArsR family transcriptional regulator
MAVAAPLPLIDSFSALADPTRCRVLSLVEGHELTVGELCDVLQLPQSTVSRHLKTLAEAGWVLSRRDGTSRYYALSLDGGGGAHREIWKLTRDQVAGRPGAAQDGRRLEAVLTARRETSERFFATSAGQWDRLREELFGREFALRALVGLLPRHWTVADLGCGTGSTLGVIAPHVGRAVGVDASDEMLASARTRTARCPNVDLRRGLLEALPLGDAEVDAAFLMLVLHHLATPARALAEAGRVVRPGGRLLVVDMLPHGREDYRRQMGHVWLGFPEDQMRRWLAQAGFDEVALTELPAAAGVMGPALFAMSAVRRST